MSVNYDLYETPNPDKEGEVLPLHARVVLKGSYTAEEIADQVVAFQRMPHAQVVGIIEAISKELQHLLLKGFSVELGDIGYFTLSLSVDKEVTKPKDLRSPAVSLKDINLRINRQFKKDIESELVLQRYHSPFRVKNPCINRQDYASLVGKTKTQALKDINTFIGQGILRKYGTGRSVVYIKAE